MPPSPSYIYDTIPAARSTPNVPHVEPTTSKSMRKPISSCSKCIFNACSLNRFAQLYAQSLDALSLEERESVNTIWSNFSSSSHPRHELILQGLLTMCCFSQLSLLTEQLAHLIRIDPFVVLPREVALKILGYLDATSLCRAAQVSR